MTHTPRRAPTPAGRVICLAVVAALAAAACGGPTPAPSATPLPVAPEVTATASEDLAPIPIPEPDPDHPARTTTGPTGLVVYSGRTESLVGPLIQAFEATSGLHVDVRYGDTGELALTLLEEGTRSPADVFFAQEPGGLGAVSAALAPLPEPILNAVDPRFRAPDGRWVGISGRVRVVVYNTDAFTPADLPSDIRAFTDPKWKGRVGWAPANASFQTMVTAMRLTWGEDATRQWVEGMVKNDAVDFPKNGPIVQAVANGEIDVGLVNHYYLYGFLTEEGDGFKARNMVLQDGGPASILLVAGAAILKTAPHREVAERFVRFLLDHEAQVYFAEHTFEYPLSAGVPADPKLPALDGLPLTPLNLGDLSDTAGSVRLLRDAGALP